MCILCDGFSMHVVRWLIAPFAAQEALSGLVSYRLGRCSFWAPSSSPWPSTFLRHWALLLFHPCCYCGGSHSPAGSYSARCGAASASRILPGCCRGHRYIARFYCSLCDRGDGPGGRQKHHAGITQCVRAGCSAPPGLWRAIHSMCEARGGQSAGKPPLSLTAFFLGKERWRKAPLCRCRWCRSLPVLICVAPDIAQERRMYRLLCYRQPNCL